MILEHAAYFLNDDYQILNEAVADKSIPNAVRWVINWLDKIGLGKDPNHEGEQITNFNNADYYRRTIPDPDVTGMTPAEANAARAEVNNRRRNAPNTHNRTEAETIVEAIVEEFSHPIDYNRNGKHKMFVQAFTRIALTECNFLTEHPNTARIEMLKKCYLTATMMWKRDSSMFGNDCNMQNITYGQLVTACKPHFEEMHELWQAEKTAYENERMRRLAINRIRERRTNNGEDPDAEITDEMIAAEIERLRGESDNVTGEPDDTEVEPEVDPETVPHIPPTVDPNNELNPYNNMENPYMEGSFRLGHYNITRIDNYEQSHTWQKFTNTEDDVTNPDAGYMGGISWCITYDQSHWNSYGCGARRTVYYAWTDDFRSLQKENYREAYGDNATPYTDWGRSLMCIMIDQDRHNNWRFAQCTSRYNHGDGDGESCSNTGFGDEFYHNDDHDTWAKKVAEIIGVDFETFKEKLPYVRANNTGRAAGYMPAEHDENEVTARIKNFEFYQNIRYLAGTFNADKYNVKYFKEHDETAIVLNGNRISNEWFRDVKLADYNKIYFIVRRLSGKYNILDENGNYLLKNDVVEIKKVRKNKKYLIICLNYDATEIIYNIFDFSTKKLKFKQPHVVAQGDPLCDVMESGYKNFDYIWDDYGDGRGKLTDTKGNIIINTSDYTEHDSRIVQVPYNNTLPNSNKDFLYIYRQTGNFNRGNSDGYMCYKMKENINLFEDMPLYLCADRYSYVSISDKSNAHFITARLYDPDTNTFESEKSFCLVTKNAIKKLNPYYTLYPNNTNAESLSSGFIKNTDLAYYVHRNNNNSLSVVILKYNDDEITEYNRYNLPSNIGHVTNIIPDISRKHYHYSDELFSGKYLTYCERRDTTDAMKIIDTITGDVISGSENIKITQYDITNMSINGLIFAKKNNNKDCACKIDTKNNKIITFELPSAYRKYNVISRDFSRSLNGHFDCLKFCHSDNNNNFIFGLFYDGKLIAIIPDVYYFNALSEHLVIGYKRYKYIILNEHGKHIFNGVIDKIISVPGVNNDIGSFKDDHDILYYFNDYGDVSRNIENVEESIIKHISKEKLFLEKVAYYC